MFFLVLDIDFIPLERVLGTVILRLPVGDVAGDESTPELGIFAADLGGTEFDLVELLGGVDSLEHGADFPVFEGADVSQACWIC